MKTYGTSLLRRWLHFACLVGAGYFGQVLAEARVITLRGNFCQTANPALELPIYWRAEITIDPTQVTPPDNVIVHSGFFMNTTGSNPYDFLSVEYGNARGFWTVTWRTNTTDAYRAAEPVTVSFSDSDTILSLNLGPDDCGLYTPPEYCITVKACNDGIYYRKFHLFNDYILNQSSGYIAPGACHTFAEVCTTNKAGLYIRSTDLRETDTGFEQQTGPTTAPPLNDGAWSTNGSSGGAAVSTNFTGNPPAAPFNPASSNNQAIAFQGGTNAATDQTARDGFNALYKATVDGFESTKAVIRNGFDGLGTNVASGNNINRTGFLSLSNGLSGLNGTMLGMSNGLRGEQNSNNIFATRQNTSNSWETLRAITNLLGMTAGLTNSPNTSTQQSSGESAAEATRDALTGLVGSIPNGGGSVPSDVGDWSFTVGAVSMDLNPLQGQFAGIASFIRNFILWCVTLAYIGFVISHTMETMRAVAAARQASAASATPGISSGTALAMAAAITVAVATIPALLVATLNGGLLTTLGVSPFAGATGAIGMGIALANAYIPLDSILTYATAGLAFQLSIGALFWVATTVIRFLVGCIVFWIAISSAFGTQREVKVQNQMATPMYVQFWNYSGILCIQPGQEYKLNDAVDDSVVQFDVSRTLPISRAYEELNLYVDDADKGGVLIQLCENGVGWWTYRTATDWAEAGFQFGLVVVGFGLVIFVVRGIRNQTSEV